MGNEDFITRIQEALMEFASVSAGGLPDSAELLKKLEAILHEVQVSGAMPTEDLENQIAMLKDLQSLNDAAHVAIADGDSAALEGISEKTAKMAGLELMDYPEIFDAIQECDRERVKTALVDWDINQTHGQYEQTALYAAMANMFGVSLEMVDMLLDAGADPRKGLSDSNVLHGLGFGQCTDVSPKDLAEIVKRCVSLGADIEQRTNNLQWTPLHTALNEWNDVASEALLLAGADPNACAGSRNRAVTSGQNCLVMSVGRSELFTLLLGYGADPDLADEHGRTAASEVARLLSEIDCGDYRAELMQSRDALKKHGKQL